MRHLLVALSLCAFGVSAALGQQPGQPAPGQPTRTPPRAPTGQEAPLKGTASLKGRVLAADTGAPVRRAQVRAFAMESRAGGVTATDAQGDFEFRDLPAGRYTVGVSKGGFVGLQYGQKRPGQGGTPIELGEGQRRDNILFALPRGSVLSGRILDDLGEPVSGVMVTAMQYRFFGGARRLSGAFGEGGSDRTDDQGHYRLYGLSPGEYVVSATYRGGMFVGPNENNTEPEGYAPTYYPGTPNKAEAQSVAVRVGQELSNVTFPLIIARMARVAGRAVSSTGEPLVRAMVMLRPEDESLGGVMFSAGNTHTKPDGAFELPNVPPGRYVVEVRPMMQGPPTPETESGRLAIVVGSVDLDDLFITTGVGAVARGRIIFDTGAPADVRPAHVRLFAQPGRFTPSASGFVMPTVREDWTFELSGMLDERLIRAMVESDPTWTLKAVLHDGLEVTDSPIDFQPGMKVDGLEVVLTQTTTQLSGLVTNDRGEPVTDAYVVVFPDDPERWTFASRWVRTMRPDEEGRYRTRGLPPAMNYRIVAVRDLEEGQSGDPEFLHGVRDIAAPLTLAEGETKDQPVRLTRVR